MFETFRRRFWIGYFKALASYFLTQPPPADVEQIMEDLGWNAAQDEILLQDNTYVPQERTIS